MVSVTLSEMEQGDSERLLGLTLTPGEYSCKSTSAGARAQAQEVVLSLGGSAVVRCGCLVVEITLVSLATVAATGYLSRPG